MINLSGLHEKDGIVGGSIASKAYMFAVNKYINKVDPEHKRSRNLLDGELHVPLHNFTGPGTRIDLAAVRNFPPYNNIDKCSREHDLAYDRIKNDTSLSKETKAEAIMTADKDAIKCYDETPKEYGHDAAKLGISGKLGLETLLSILKGKATTVYGGIINHYDDEALLKSRNPEYYTDDEKDIIDILKINNDDSTIIQPVGSFTYSIQKYPSDIDLNQLVSITDISTFVKDLKKLIRKIEKNSCSKDRSVFFTDFKAGKNPNDSEKGLKWSAKQILDGEQVVDGKTILLEDSLLEQSVIKLDIVIISHESNRIIEASTFFILLSSSTGEYINVPQNFFDLFVDGVKNDILKYSTQGENFKLFKAIKRMWSLARLKKDINMLQKLAPIIDSSLSILSQINADMETIILLIEKYGKSVVKTDGIQNVLNGFEKRLSTIVDVNEVMNSFDDIASNIEALKDLSSKGWGTRAEEILEHLHDQLLSIINNESFEFIKSIGLWPIPSDYLP